jgi:2-keto-4-pentenoate hydratase
MSGFDARTAVESFWAARSQTASGFRRHGHGKLSTGEAYQVLFGLMARRLAAGERQIGWKVGLTSKAIQQQFNVHEPVLGCILESRQSGHVFAPVRSDQPRIRERIVPAARQGFVGRGHSGKTRAPPSTRSTRRWKSSRTRGNLTEQLALALADNAQQKTVILGAPAVFPARVRKRSRCASSSTARRRPPAPATPCSAIRSIPSSGWRRSSAEYGRSLKAGDIIMSGSFTRQFPINPGRHDPRRVLRHRRGRHEHVRAHESDPRLADAVGQGTRRCAMIDAPAPPGPGEVQTPHPRRRASITSTCSACAAWRSRSGCIRSWWGPRRRAR